MGDKVVFTVALDEDGPVDVAPVARDRLLVPVARRTVVDGVRSRRWRTLAIATGVAPWLGIVAVRLWLGPSPAETLAPVLLAVAAGTVVAAIEAAHAVRRAVTRQDVDQTWSTRQSWAATAGAVVGAIILGVLALAAGLPALLWTISAAGFGEAQTLPMSAAAGAAVAVGALVGALSSQVAPGVHPTVGAAAAAVAVLLVPPMIFAATVPLTVSDDTISRHSFTVGFRDVSGRAYPAYVCDSETEIVRRAHPDRVAWLLTLTPLGVVADAPELPASALATAPRGGLPWAQAQMRQARLGPAPFEGYCYQPTSLGTPEAVQERRFESGGANPWLVLTEIVVLAATLAVVSRRTRW